MKQIFMALVLAVSMTGSRWTRAAGPAPVDMGSTAHFAVLAGSAITSTGGGTLDGDIGLSPGGGSEITGVTTSQVNGTIYAVDAAGPAGAVVDPALLTTAKNDLTAAYTNAAGRSATTSFGPVYDLGGQTLTSGVYRGSSSFGITGTLTLDAQGNPDAVWIFQAASTLIAESGSSVVLTNGALAQNIFWQVGDSATLKTLSVFKGTIMAQASITMNANSKIDGRALARSGAVTFDSLAGHLSILSISVSPSTWTVGTVGTGTVQMSSSENKLSVTNGGTVAETFTLAISNEDDRHEWTHSPSKSGAGDRIYVLSGIFCNGADLPTQGSFSQTDSEDVLTLTEQGATATHYAYATGTADGQAVPANAARSLWLRLDTPTDGTAGIEHTVTVRVGCFQPL